MGIEFFFIAVILLAIFAVFDLTVGVSNDAVNFLNSSIGSRVAPRHIIMIIASLGILAGVTFSSGMMEVARKGIFHPNFFTMPELLYMFIAVMLTDIVLLDFFNTYGMPTSTTVSIVFGLLGAAVAASIIKIWLLEDDISTIANYINTSKALIIVVGILLSVAVAFIAGAIIQFISRTMFTFDYAKRIGKFGAIWGGVAMASITYFILIKGAHGASYITEETAAWMMSHAWTLFLIIIPISAIILQILIFLKINIFKPIVLIGTFALAMAFAANDLVNFIGVPIAGYHAFRVASKTEAPLTTNMDALAQKVPTDLWILILAGVIMMTALWLSRKARRVTDTSLELSQQDEGVERFDSSFPARAIVSFIRNTFNVLQKIIPAPAQRWFTERFDAENRQILDSEGGPAKFDLVRASVNLMVASAVISYATSQKLPLSTTYVTFMVAMGTSFADRAWGRESAVYRVTGVLTVIGGWFMTGLLAFTISALFTAAIFALKAWGTALLLIVGGLIIWKNRSAHNDRTKTKEMDKVFNLKKVKDISDTLYNTFEHMGYLLREIRESLNATLDALFEKNGNKLGIERGKTKKIQRWANIIIANIFKAMRLMQKDNSRNSFMYGQTIRRVQKLADGHRDITIKAHEHVINHHKGLLDIQVQELTRVKELLNDILLEVEMIISRKQTLEFDMVRMKSDQLRKLAQELHEKQSERIRKKESKTRLSILFYAIVGNAMMLSKQNVKLLEIFKESFGTVAKVHEFDMD